MQTGAEALKRLISRWVFDPSRFCREALGFRPSNQQEAGFAAVSALVRAKDRRGRGLKLTAAEQELAGKIGLSIASGHGTGKDRFLAATYLWFLTCWPRPKGLVTGPNFATLKSVLWHEFRKLVRTSTIGGGISGWLASVYEIQHDRLIHRLSGGESFVEARTANVRGTVEEQGEALAGRHEAYMLMAVDEASGVPDGVFRPLEGALAGRVNFAILIGNMTRRSGYFYDSHHDRGASRFWIPLRWDTEESDLDQVSGGATNCAGVVRFYESRYGRSSNAFRVRIQGYPPSAEDDGFIPWDWIERSIGADLLVSEDDAILWGLDVAYEGKDRTVLCCRRGGRVEWLRDIRHYDPMQVSGWVAGIYSEAREAGEAPDAIFVDSIGIGAGVTARLRELGFPVHSVVVSEKAVDPRYGNVRNELWHRLRQAFERGAISLPEDEELIDELSSMKCHPPDSSGVVRVYSKSEWRRSASSSAGVNSPDKSDALCLTYALGSQYIRPRPGSALEEVVMRGCAYRPLDVLTGY